MPLGAFLGLKVYQMYHLFHLHLGTAQLTVLLGNRFAQQLNATLFQ